MPAVKQLEEMIRPLAMRNFSIVQKALRETTQKRAAELMNVAESTFSDFAADHLERAMQVIAAVGLKVVPREEHTLSPAKIAAYKLLAREALDAEEPAQEWGTF